LGFVELFSLDLGFCLDLLRFAVLLLNLGLLVLDFGARSQDDFDFRHFKVYSVDAQWK